MNIHERLLDTNGPVALIIRERLRSVAGKSSVVFPPTYAPDRDSGQKKSGYNIDEYKKFKNGNRCTIDSVQSQANRIEPMFKESPYSALVPQIVIKSGIKEVNLLDAAHRLADAAVRFSELEEKVDTVFQQYYGTGDACPIAELNPMSILFGAWDSRGTQAKLPRLFSSSIYADDVEELTRSSQFTPSFTVADIGLSEEELSEQEKDKWSRVGLAHAPGKALGGVIVHGGITREATLNLVALRHLKGTDPERTEKLQNYILSLALVCATLEQDYDLRSGCQLVRDGKDACTCLLVNRDGSEEPIVIDHKHAIALAAVAAEEFGIPATVSTYHFRPEKARESLDEAEAKKAKKANRAKKGAA